MRIVLENLEGGKSDIAHLYQPDELNPIDERVQLTAPATVNGQLRVARNEVFVNGHVETRAKVECDRCLKPVELPVNTDFALEYISGVNYESSAAAELTEADLLLSVFDGKTIDVDE